jgi:hypothetical protein
MKEMSVCFGEEMLTKEDRFVKERVNSSDSDGKEKSCETL